ncbi:penicillin-binding transpeptidase domain-containing protein [Tahibacter amnicola]|uniref:beta-lactamase n=1 Tax=Tahibacter amnicola TaxID=2976241 RepID=A0ABY6BGW0_9GAMM|nr:penicillin-binding transpeptidase domain-containing protein [Tahibacter amnicola]UXI67841.1 penicillin-binding transpeptidase domain-containing protein [Tahibacter amnicola]
MTRWRPLAFFLLALLAAPAAHATDWEVHPEWEKAFSSRGLTGTLLLYDAAADRYRVFDRQRAQTPLPPASTYKVFNAMVALETGVIRDEHVVFPWDGQKRWVDNWNRDHDLASGMKFSVVWYYQELARRIGRERMQHWIDAAGYGNRDIGGDIDSFWLGGGGKLRISAVGQIEFLRKLADGSLPFSARSQEIARRITVVEEAPAYVVHGKTGLGDARRQKLVLRAQRGPAQGHRGCPQAAGHRARSAGTVGRAAEAGAGELTRRRQPAAAGRTQ